jgi:hypothetical protein
MADKQIVFADRLVNLAVHNGLVRMDFATMAGATKTKEGEDAVKMAVTTQLVLPIDAFIAAITAQQKFVGQLREIGKRRAEGKKGAEGAAQPAGN